MAGLREQWRRSAMREIQDRALDLFEERGFDAVTIEAVAAAAEVSPSSVYRYFGTKEGLLVADEFDAMTADELTSTVDPDDPIASLLRMVRRYEARPEEISDGRVPDAWRRVPFFFTVPSVRAALLSSADAASKRIAPLIARNDAFTPSQARVLSNALTFGYLVSLELWFSDGRIRPIADYVEEGLRPLRTLWTDTAPSS
ncbi:TetR/AcrR family transcriptional regulator [Nocardiopsis composta]|uniref:AcrR family transcriptional regulator n=1 Tax=Nocardiopsis composta TaxID=157465 RepID=A0A7W8VF00_9ACTN|nr:TetR/AcrR family transcriptional regulator [Nocardiopsis composta]MBB5434051.1 AcrR family transcriptional regulator [Nocardiopsis composta]